MKPTKTPRSIHVAFCAACNGWLDEADTAKDARVVGRDCVLLRAKSQKRPQPDDVYACTYCGDAGGRLKIRRYALVERGAR